MLRSKSLVTVGAVTLALFMSVASAQAQPRGRGGRGGFGGGGFGGGMFGAVGLLRMEEVRKELNVTDEQNKEIEAAMAQLAPPGGGGGFGGPDLSDEERQKRMDEMRKRGEEVQAKVNKILKPEQSARLKQLSLQQQGVNALTRPEVAKDLGLTKEQEEKLTAIQEAARPQRREGGGFQNLSDEERQKLFTEMRERQAKVQTEMLAVLTDEQKTKFAEMKGKEFDFPAFGGFGGGAGGGGNRRRPATKQREE
ncbi:MAG TPA: hypothetical protein VHC22_22420 [Pirellulales bacterium]|nr:hypothetical protein [Pirellulales bacterium]